MAREITPEVKAEFRRKVAEVCTGPVRERIVFAVQHSVGLLMSVINNIRIDVRQGVETSPYTAQAVVVTLKRAIALIEGDVDAVLKLQEEGDQITTAHDAEITAREAAEKGEVLP